MKAILMSIRPQWVAKILNGEKTIEIRKRFPKDYVGWVYIYVTHGQQLLDLRKEDTKDNYRLTISKSNNVRWSYPPLLNGKVIARFWCDKVEHIEYETCSRDISGWWKDNGEIFNHKDTCLTYEEMFDYIGSGDGYAIHISKLEVFDKPKEISEFMRVSCKGCPFENTQTCHNNTDGRYCKLTRAPESFCYIEID